MQPFLGGAARELCKIVSRKKSAFAIEHRYLQFVAVVRFFYVMIDCYYIQPVCGSHALYLLLVCRNGTRMDAVL
jgi:hypothetical protein